MDNLQDLKRIVEALLMVSEHGLSSDEIMGVVPDITAKDLRQAVDTLNEDYNGEKRSFYIVEIAGKFRIATKPEYVKWVNSLYQSKSARLTGPSLETLAILAYKQPITRAEIEAIRGVNVGGVIKTLLEKDLVRVRGRKEVIGKPLLYGTTEKFLELFGLNSLDDLPMLKDFVQDDLEYGNKELSPVVENVKDVAGEDKGQPASKKSGEGDDGEHISEEEQRQGDMSQTVEDRGYRKEEIIENNRPEVSVEERMSDADGQDV